MYIFKFSKQKNVGNLKIMYFDFLRSKRENLMHYILFGSKLLLKKKHPRKKTDKIKTRNDKWVRNIGLNDRYLYDESGTFTL